ncbi:MAG TPA: hypothetical protein IAC01_02630 [Candidatus Limicola stercorigallinarum]|nr:hypothetical protein [Candidatus Limicola stercorigallinarum]
MKPIDLSNVEESDGGYASLKPGAYKCTIMKVEDVPAKEYLRVFLDIIEGEFKDYFSDPFYEDKPFARSIIMSYKEAAKPFLKGRLHVISDCNQGFDAEAAINAGKEQMLVGKAVGVVFREEEYYDKKTGEFKMGSPRPDRLVRFDEMGKDSNANPKPKMLDDAGKRGAMERAGVRTSAGTVVTTSDIYDDDIPFD